MRKHYYRLAFILRDVAYACKARGDTSATTIRCAINDAMDSWAKDGWRVAFNYNQERAIKEVRRIVRDL